MIIREGNDMTNNKQIINDTRAKNALRKAFKCNSPEGLFYNLKKSELILYESDSDVKAAIHQNEHIILNIEKKNVSQILADSQRYVLHLILMEGNLPAVFSKWNQYYRVSVSCEIMHCLAEMCDMMT